MAQNGWNEHANLFAFIGNSLLNPLSRTEKIGLSPEFWEAFPRLGDAATDSAVESCRRYAEQAQKRAVAGEDMVQEVSVEYTMLFVGPPSPTAPPWETFNRAEDVSFGFGEPTYQMRRILADMGLAVSNANNQYADHIGIELLTLSEMLRELDAGKRSASNVFEFLNEHPRGWIGKLREKVCAVAEDGYYVNLLALAESALDHTAEQLR